MVSETKLRPPKFTVALGEWASQSKAEWSQIVFERARHAMVDGFSSMVAGANDKGVALLRAATVPYGTGNVTMIGSFRKVPALWAALVNGYASHAVEMDDNFHPGLAHATAVIAPSIWALGEDIGATGADVIDAYIIGTEVMARVGLGIGLAHSAKGWHPTATIGSIAAAAACGRLLKLDKRKMTNAISIACSMSAGCKEQFGTMAKPLHPGLAAKGGVLAALLAQSGIEGSHTIMEGEKGFGALYAGDTPPDWSAGLRDSEPLALEQWGLAVKMYPCCGSTHRIVDGMMDKALYGNNSAKMAIDTALYDLNAKALDVPLYQLLGGCVRETVMINRHLGIMSAEEAVEKARAYVKEGFKSIKMKVGNQPDQDINCVQAVRDAVGTEIRIRIDANGGYTYRQALRVTRALADVNLEMFEQPLPKWGVDGMVALRKIANMPLGVDESINSVRDAMVMAQRGAADVFTIKLVKTGGLYPALQIAGIAYDANVSCVVASTYDTQLNAAHCLHLACALPGEIIPCDLTCYATQPTQADTCHILKDGMLTVGNESGCGVRSLIELGNLDDLAHSHG